MRSAVESQWMVLPVWWAGTEQTVLPGGTPPSWDISSLLSWSGVFPMGSSDSQAFRLRLIYTSRKLQVSCRQQTVGQPAY
jgi:hypothetical protein